PMAGPPAPTLAFPPARQLPRILAVAALCAAAMAASFVAGAGAVDAVAAAALVPVVSVIALIDARWYLIPDSLNVAALLLGLVHAMAAADEPVAGALAALARGAVLALLFLALRQGYRALRGREGLGLGDVKLAGVAGVWLGVEAIPIAIEIAALSALLAIGIRHCFWRRTVQGLGLGRGGDLRRMRLPFGLFLAPSIWIAWLIERWLIAAW
ncbi:prepilin peptidase, partial [Xanthobacter sp. KR7-65]|uniref:prepilin peptidase n=1 Tax=Xanthobacter sp. KR7-65 TaxID=3156612 RepID=UPI0032B4BB26